MKVTLESTSQVVMLEVNGVGVPARLWEGETPGGVKVHAYITRIAHDIHESPERVEEFKRDLQQTVAPRAKLDAIPFRMVI